MFDKSARFKQVCQLLLSLIVGLKAFLGFIKNASPRLLVFCFFLLRRPRSLARDLAFFAVFIFSSTLSEKVVMEVTSYLEYQTGQSKRSNEGQTKGH